MSQSDLVMVLEYLRKLFESIGTHNVWAVLVALTNLIIALLKNEKIWVFISKRFEKGLVISKRARVLSVIFVGIVLSLALVPKGTVFESVMQGLMIALSAMGTYSCYKYLIKGKE